MTDTRHRTVIEIGVDDRQVRGLGQAIDEALSDQAAIRFEQSLDRTVRAMDKLIDRVERLNKADGGGAGRRGRPPPTFGGGFARGLFGGLLGGPMGGAMAGALSGTSQSQAALGGLLGGYVGGLPGMAWRGANQLSGLAGAAAGPSGFSAQAFGGIPLIGPFIQAGIGAIMSFYQEHVAQMRALSRSVGVTGSARTAHLGLRWGVGPTEMPGMAAQFAQQSSLTGDALIEPLRRHLALQMLLGVQNAGNVVGAGRVAGGEVQDPVQMMTDAVGTGLAIGVRETRLDEYLSNMSSWVEQIRRSGIDFTPESAMRFTHMFGQLGGRFAGEAGAGAAQSTVDAFRQGPDRPGVMSLLRLRAVGFGRPGGPGFLEAMERIENPRAEDLSGFIDIARRMGGSGPRGIASAAILLRQMMPHLSFAQAHQLAEQGLPQAEMDSPGAITDAVVAERRRNVIGTFAAPRFEAQMEAARGGMGGRYAETAQAIQMLDMRIARIIAPHLSALAGQLVEGANSLLDIFQREGVMGVVRAFFEAAMSGAAGVGADALSDIFGGDASNYEAVVRGLIDSATPFWMRIPGVTAPAVAPAPSSPGTERGGDTQIDTGESSPVPEADPMGPQGSAADALRRAEEALREARGHIQDIGTLRDSDAVGYG